LAEAILSSAIASVVFCFAAQAVRLLILPPHQFKSRVTDGAKSSDVVTSTLSERS